jgi:hypothetical protein
VVNIVSHPAGQRFNVEQATWSVLFACGVSATQ